MSQAEWDKVDQHFNDLLVKSDPALDKALKASEAAGLPPIAVSKALGKFLYLTALIGKAERILEIGTLGGYSTIWLGKALPKHGRLITLEYDPRHARIASENVKKAGLEGLIDIRVGAALDLLPAIEKESDKPFDFIFIDADKENNSHYFSWALRLSAPGSVILIDNVVRGGRILDVKSEDTKVRGTQALHDLVSQESRVSSTVIQTVGSKGYDGFMLMRVVN